jgi:protein-disulfide isomerase
VRACIFVCVFALGSFAQNPPAPKTTEPAKTKASTPIPDTIGSIDLSELSQTQRKAALKLMNEQDCSCQCGMKTAECLVKDPNCSYSKSLAKVAIKGIKEGKSLIEISKLMDASPKAHRPKLLEDPVKIPVEGSPSRGPADARITIVEFSDFECPYCSVAVKEVATIQAAYPKDIKLIYKQFPLSMHPNAPLAAAASLAAKEQGKFWEMHDLLFANFHTLSRDNMLSWAKQIGLDVNKFKADLDSGKFQAIVKKDLSDGEAAGVYGTPAFFINGKLYNGTMKLDALKPILDVELKPAAPAKKT